MSCNKHFDLSSSLTASFVARFIICWVCRLYFSGLVCSVLFLDECLIKINYGRFCVCFRCLEKVILWSRLCLAKDEFRYHRLRVYLIMLSGINDLRRQANMMWSTNVKNISSRRNSFGLGPHLCQQNKHIPLKKMITRTTCKAVDCFLNVGRLNIQWRDLIYIYIYFYYVCKTCIDITPTNSPTKWEDYMKAWNYITIDFNQEMG